MLHFGLFGGRQVIDKKTSRQQKLNHLTRINFNIERCKDADVLIAQGKFLTLCNSKSVAASKHPDKGVFHFGLQILAIS
jgi:hypothetical protein